MHERSFRNIPIIFCGALEDQLSPMKPDSHFTGAWAVADPEKTLNLAVKLLPNTRHVVVVGGVGPLDRELENIVRQDLGKYESAFEFTYLTDLDLPAVLDRLQNLPTNTIVVFTSFRQDAAGTRFIGSTQSLPAIAAAANAPVFVLDDVAVGSSGAVGGEVLSWAEQGRVAAGIAVRVLNGEKPGDIPLTETPTVNMFDWQAMRRFGLRVEDLPPGSILLNRETTVWESYKWYIIGGISLILVQALLIFELLWLRARRKKMQRELVIINDRLHLAFEGGSSVGWDWDVKTGRDHWFGNLEMMFGIPGNTYAGTVEDFLRRVYPDDRELVGKAVADARRNRKPYTAAFRIIREDGDVRWVNARGNFYYGTDGDALRMVGIAVDITEQRKIEEALKKSEEKFSKAFRHSPMSLTISTARENRYVDVNETFLERTGWKREEVIGRTASDLGLWVDPEERVALVNRLLAGDVIRNVEFQARMRNGQVRTASRSAELIEINGELCVLSVTADITHLKHVEATLRESEERFRLVANTAPVMIWMTGVDRLRNYFNLPWLEFTGRSLEEELGMGWAEGMHPDDYPRYMSSYTKAFDRRQPIQIEYRLRRRDGEYRWVFASGVPRFHADGSFAGYIGSAIDVTDRKMAEEALSIVSRRLIEAHEDERVWLARELHDDIGQQICLLLMSLGRLSNDMQASIAEIREGMTKAIEQASSIVIDMRALSHRLHSSKLEYLGLVAAAEGHCNEIADQHQVQVNLRTENIPRDLSQEISLCIFRVLQEALQNAIKHSHSRCFEVLLSRRSEEITLTVRDSGVGFDPVAAMKSRGLGLTSMKERLKLVDGELWIESESGVGTTVHVRVPLQAKTAVAG